MPSAGTSSWSSNATSIALLNRNLLGNSSNVLSRVGDVPRRTWESVNVRATDSSHTNQLPCTIAAEDWHISMFVGRGA